MRSCLALFLLASCVSAPPLDKAGLPRASRYTNVAQLEWLLSTYASVAEKTSDGQLREEACLGWERTVFDLESFRMYSILLRMGPDSSALESLREEVSPAKLRHPLPKVCLPPAAEVVSAPDAQPEEPGVAPPQSPAAPAAAPQSPERQQLGELRQALRFTQDAGQPGAEVDMEKLAQLAKSGAPAIQLRARFHLLGRCQLIVERSDRRGTAGDACTGGQSGEAPRRSMNRLRNDLLRAWSRKNIEPMSEIVLSLASSTSRDNPLVDGPRVTR